jgi:hypothetical protein
MRKAPPTRLYIEQGEDLRRNFGAEQCAVVASDDEALYSPINRCVVEALRPALSKSSDDFAARNECFNKWGVLPGGVGVNGILGGRCFCLQDTALPDIEPEKIAESVGADGDAYRFRYSECSPEECYSPIAAMMAYSGNTGTAHADQVFSTHEDEDGAICSEPIHCPLSLIVRARDGSELTFKVRNGQYLNKLSRSLLDHWLLTMLPRPFTAMHLSHVCKTGKICNCCV